MPRGAESFTSRQADRCLLARAAVLLVAIRFGLRWLPQRVIARWLRRADATATPRLGPSHAARRGIRAIERVARHIPGCENCLVQALAVHVWLRRHGETSDLRIGVVKRAHGRLTAHAWIESRREIVTGNRPDLHTYHVLHRRTASTYERDRGPVSL